MEYKKLGDIITLKRGYDLPNQCRVKGKYPVVGSNNITGYHNEYKVSGPGVTIGRSGNLGGAIYLSDNFWPLNTTLYVEDFKGNHPKYIYYLLKSINFKVINAGSSVPTLNRNHAHKILVKFANYKNQICIANILSSLNHKIEVNNKIIANLEEQAQAIFKSWFVDFDPFQNEEFIESELGMIPKGWEIGALGNSSLGKLMGSGIDKFEGEKIYLATADVVDTIITNLDTKVSFNHRPSRANMQPEPLSVWFAKMKDSRKLILVNESDAFIYNHMIFSTGFAGIKATPYSVYYLWTYLLTEEFNLIKDSYCQGTTMQAINNKNINKISIKMPPEPVLKEFSDITKPMFELISKLTQQNQTLSELRDALLPKLMSGEIDVSQISVEDEVDES